jgi:hypothetical protein
MIKPNTVYEIFDLVQKATTDEDRVKILKDNNCLAIRDVLRASFDDTIVFTLPTGTPPYKDSLSKEGLAPTNLIRSTTQFTYFVKGGQGDQLNSAKRESIFVRLLEGIHPRDAKIVCAMKDKKLQEEYPALTKELVKTVWPKLILS